MHLKLYPCLEAGFPLCLAGDAKGRFVYRRVALQAENGLRVPGIHFVQIMGLANKIGACATVFLVSGQRAWTILGDAVRGVLAKILNILVFSNKKG